jgi:uncharacterized OB-fold protein
MTNTSTYTTPLPDPADPLTGPHWAAARDQRLAVQRCTSCGALRWQPAAICPECLTTGGEWTDLAGTGTVWSYTVYHRAMNPAFADRVPYAVAMIELDEGIRMIGMLTGTDIAIGDPVRAVYDPVTDDVTLIRWERVDAT